MAAQTLAQKLIARASHRQEVAVNEIVTCAVDLAMFHDSSGPRRLKPMLEKLGAQIWDKSKVVLVMDHYVPEEDDDSRRILKIARDWASEQQLPNVYDSIGICHVVLPQKGHLRPGMFCVGGDSHSPTGGAFGAYMFGIGSTEMLGVVVTGEIWVRTPPTIAMDWSGLLPAGVTAKDMMLHMIGLYGTNGANYAAVEYTGSAVSALSMQERMTLSNMSAELGAQVGLIAPDQTTLDYLESVGVNADVELDYWRSDDAAQREVRSFDASTLSPMVAAPHSPDNVHPVDHMRDIPVQVAYIGACTGAKLEDLRAAATVLKGQRVDSGVRLMVAPATLRDQQEAQDEGIMDILVNAGAQVFATSCGACSGYGNALKGAANVISSTARNFKGRMGSADTQVYLASPYTVAASALTGRISDPRIVLTEGKQ
ncbi:3-isopropylmalate/(R)-2-methylmalate dehydratase large subunit [Advenella incenata]|jgi:3-isopropylmalate/(R)-2-methylmalate dehydratase large subunit|uniref:3-isopropylmalate/(R)-2-methylmalate dehydratase large subunit n=1 Tax=Advenella incenata TaxID=267800 RepID=A0A4Q7VEF7_9BURK|nr:3-isopropylmalate dehydratase large subunit [Advenella incenata]RZT94484.1 3-isopropylmalate/(R)-2-methylmalate dehydratase large subunit [Advenella incenata]